MKKIKNKKILFICNFLGILIFLVIMQKFVGRKGPPWSWEEILNGLPITIIGSLGFAVWVGFTRDKGDDDEKG